MKLSVKDVENVAKLARLSLEEHEKEKFKTQLESILNYVEKLSSVDTKNCSYKNVLEKAVLRDDIAVSSNLSEDILSNAPFREGKFFKVKKVIE